MSNSTKSIFSITKRIDINSIFSVTGKVVLITGGGRGIGRMIAEGFVQAGAIVYISSRKEKMCNKTAKELNSLGPGQCIAIPADLSTVKQCHLLAQRLKTEYNVTKLDVLINNSGCSWGEPLKTFSEKGWDKVMDLNVKTVFFLTQALIPLLEVAGTKVDPARIINISSIAGLKIEVGFVYSYFTSKAALIHLSKKLASELAHRNITVNCICPGLVPTDMSKMITSIMPEKKLLAMIPLCRPGLPEDMAGPCIFLSSRAASWITGTVIPIDGGTLVSDGIPRARL